MRRSFSALGRWMEGTGGGGFGKAGGTGAGVLDGIEGYPFNTPTFD